MGEDGAEIDLEVALPRSIGGEVEVDVEEEKTLLGSGSLEASKSPSTSSEFSSLLVEGELGGSLSFCSEVASTPSCVMHHTNRITNTPCMIPATHAIWR